MSANWTQEELNRELELERIAEKELDNATQLVTTVDVMINVEKMRKELHKKNPDYTKKYVAEKACITYQTYSNYQNDKRGVMRIDTLQNLANVLNCRVLDIFHPAVEEDEQD